MSNCSDPYELSRFVVAQEKYYEVALTEITNGAKESHWMWFVFPQLKELGKSSVAVKFGIADIDEAHAYLNHPLLGPRLTLISNTLLTIESRSVNQILGSPDDLKLLSCATLFSKVDGDYPVFQRILDKFYGGRVDSRTIELLR